MDAGWESLGQQLLDKVAQAGREVLLIDSALTSETGPNNGLWFEGLIWTHCWGECASGLSLDRDHNAVLNVFKRAGSIGEPERSDLPQVWHRTPAFGRGKRHSVLVKELVIARHRK